MTNLGGMSLNVNEKRPIDTKVLCISYKALSVYYGQSGRGLKARAKEHLRFVKQGSENIDFIQHYCKFVTAF